MYMYICIYVYIYVCLYMYIMYSIGVRCFGPTASRISHYHLETVLDGNRRY